MKIMMMNPASCLQTINLHFVNLFNFTFVLTSNQSLFVELDDGDDNE